MKTFQTIFRAALLALMMIALLFCNRPAVQRGPEQDTTTNSLAPDNTLNADTLHDADTANRLRRDTMP